ncbi:MAG: cytochrome c [Verrucomicrobia bacterium]|nr:cytochrome c [Verrucomicrobiota bacterium]
MARTRILKAHNHSERFMKRLILLTGALLFATVMTARGADVKEVWDKNCASCHGKDGKGETKAGKKAGAKDLTDAKYQATFTDDRMVKQIKEGMKDKNGKELMKPFADKLSDEEIKQIVAYVRAFKK